MGRFLDFYTKNRNLLLIEGDIGGMLNTIIKQRGDIKPLYAYAFNKGEALTIVNGYVESGLIPDKLQKIDLTGDVKRTTLDATSDDISEMQMFIFRRVDSDVKNRLMSSLKDVENSTKLVQKAEKGYNGYTTLDVNTDRERVFNVLNRWLTFKDIDPLVPNKLMNINIDLVQLEEITATAWAGVEAQMKFLSDNARKKPDYDIPDGFTFLEAKGNLRFYKWETYTGECNLNYGRKQHWLRISRDGSGDEHHTWCIAGESYLDTYAFDDTGFSVGDTLKNPFYLVRKQEADGQFMPYVMMNGPKLECKDKSDSPIDGEIANEIYPLVKGYLDEILINN